MPGSAQNVQIASIKPVFIGGTLTDLLVYCDFEMVFESPSASSHEQGGQRDFSVWASMNEGQKAQFSLLLAHFVEQATEKIGPV